MRGAGHAALQRHQGFGQAVKPDQQLQKVTVCFWRLRQRLLPGLGRAHCGIGIAPGQADVHRPLKQLGFFGLARGVQHQAVGRADIAIVKAHFGQHHLVKNRGVECRALGRFLCGNGLGHRGFGRLRARISNKSQQRESHQKGSA